jgi:thiamine monophosphate kinase
VGDGDVIFGKRLVKGFNRLTDRLEISLLLVVGGDLERCLKLDGKVIEFGKNKFRFTVLL